MHGARLRSRAHPAPPPPKLKRFVAEQGDRMAYAVVADLSGSAQQGAYARRKGGGRLDVTVLHWQTRLAARALSRQQAAPAPPSQA